MSARSSSAHLHGVGDNRPIVEDSFLDPERCQDVLAPFTARWRELAAEADRIDAGWLHGFGALYAPSGWSITPVRYFGVNNPDGIAAAPLLGELVARDGRVMSAVYLRLKGGSEIARHRGLPAGIARFHLALRVPDDCGLQVGEVSRTWVEGEWLAFDDQLAHRAWNRSELVRVVLQLDLEHPEIAVPRRMHAVRFLAGIYFDILRRNPPARSAVGFFNREIRGRLRPPDSP